MLSLVASLSHDGHDTSQIGCPVQVLRLAELRSIHREFFDSLIRHVQREYLRLHVRAVRHQRIGAKRYRTGEDMTAIIVGMLANEIHAPRRKIRPRLRRPELIGEHLLHLCQYFLFHLLFLHILSQRHWLTANHALRKYIILQNPRLW